MLDLDSGGEKPVRAYARIWGWSHKKTRISIDAMRQELSTWALNGRGTTGAQQGHSEGTKNEAKSNIYVDEGHTKGTARAQQGHTTTQTHTQTQTSITTLSPLEEGAKSKKWNAFDMSIASGLETVLIERGNLDGALSETQREQWADEFRKLREIDDKPEQVIRAVLTWLVTVDDWWISSGNFNSALKLRRKDKDGQTYFKRFELAARRSTTDNGRASIDTIEAAVARQMATGSR